MREKFLLATAVTLSLSIFVGRDLYDPKFPLILLSPVTTLDNKLPSVQPIAENMKYFNQANVDTLSSK